MKKMALFSYMTELFLSIYFWDYLLFHHLTITIYDYQFMTIDL